MNNRRFYKVGLILSIVAFIASLFLPESMGFMPPMIMGIGMLCFIVFLIALIVSGIRAKKREKAPQPTPVNPQPFTEAPSTQSNTASMPVSPPAKKATTVERVHVRGVDNYSRNIIGLGMENPDYELTKAELAEDHEGERVYQYQFFVKAALVPEPDNEFDPNAIMVQADGVRIGYVPKGSTAHVRKLMESGRIQYMDLNIGGGKYKEVYENDDGKYEMDRGETKYSAVLELHLTEEQRKEEVTP